MPAPAPQPAATKGPAPKPATPKSARPARQPAATATVESSGKPRYYVTTAISYPNGVPHIGHAYEAIATDAIARFMRLDGYDVFFLTGTDEHGIKMHQTAGKENLSPRELVERNVPRFQAMVKRLNLSNDEFIRTTEDRHHHASIGIWDKMAENGDIYLDKYSGWYSVRDEAYYDEAETKLNEQGVRVGPQGTPVEWVEEESYFFKLSAYQDKLLKLYERPDYVLPKERLNEVASFVRGGLQDLSISRTTFDWGVKVPRDPKHVMYVWVDALDQLHHGGRLSRHRQREIQALLAGRPARHRQGHRALPRGLLAGLPDVGGHRGAAAHLLARLPVQPRREDVEVGRQRHRPVRAVRRLWRRPGALLLPARGAVRPGRHLQPRGDRQPHQCRPRQRSRQPGAALAHHGGAAVRRRAAAARTFQPGRRGHARCG